MPAIREIIEVLNEDVSLNLVAQTYSEVAVAKLQRIRGRIERNRSFVLNLEQIYYLVRAAAPRAADPRKDKKGTASLLLTSNYRFYGSLEEDLIKLYAAHTPEFPTDRIVIGRMAAEYLKAIGYRYPSDQVLFGDDLPTSDELSTLMSKISNYQRVFVYYPRFQSVLVQQPTFMDITGTQMEAKTAENKGAKQAFYYIFEPEVDQMLRFVDVQMIMLLLEQAFLEAELARTAARLITMEQAQSNAGEIIKTDRKVLGFAQRQINNTRLLEMSLTLLSHEQN